MMVNDVDYLVDYIIYIQSGWWLSHTSEKYEFVSWDDYSQYMAKKNMFQNHQPVHRCGYIPIWDDENIVAK